MKLSRRTTATLLASTAVLAGLAVDTHPASAQVTRAAAAIARQSGRVLAYSPAPSYTHSTYAWSTLQAKADLYRWNGSSWVYQTTSGWWEHATTNQYGTPATQDGYGPWYVNGSNYSASFKPFSVGSGYYAVKTYLYDGADGTTTYVWNRTNVSDSGSATSCRV
jgi:hypothetical protein